MATLVRNNSGAHWPLPAVYGGGLVKANSFVLINDSLPVVFAALGVGPGDSVYLQEAADDPLGITPLADVALPATKGDVLGRTPNATIRGTVREGPTAGVDAARIAVPA